ncbi:AI-2E family transporter [Cognatishimia sp. MH4019]|uniref:AI-2E family transporter n=1 Tax=Cognatishimia sp. MH4019 TaxID=2854030 RepID=UPI001CD6C5D0|nr:AI-2E family transporter [Cognatishimia sp. MH4019]
MTKRTTLPEDIRALRRGVTVLITILIFATAYLAKDLVLPIMLGFLIALTLSPINRSLQSLGLPASIGAVLLIVLTTGAVLAVIFFAGGTARAWSQDIPGILQELRYKLTNVTEAIETVKDASEQVEDMAAPAGESSPEVVVQQPPLLTSVLTHAANMIISIGVAMILALFLLSSGDLFYTKLVQTFQKMSDKKRALTTVYDIERRVSRYLLTITLINAGLGLVVATALYLLGLEYAYIWGIAAFLLNYLPILGGIIGTLLVGVHAIVYFDALSYALLAPLVYQILTSTEAQFITPYLVGKRMELNIVAVFLTIVLWAWIWGIAGALVAVPVLLVFKVVCENFSSLNKIGNFLGVADKSHRPL